MKNDKFTKYTLPLFWIFSFLVIIFMMTIKSYASSPNGLPYIVANENISGFEDFINQIVIANSSNQVFKTAYLDGDFFGYDYYENNNHCYAFYVPQSNFNYSFSLSNNNYDSFDITQNYVDMTFSNYIYIKGYTVQAPRGYYFYGMYSRDNVSTSTTVRFFQGSNKGDGNALVPNIASQNYVYEDNQYQVVFGFGNPTPPYTGHATAPEEFDSPVYPTGHAKPDQVPTAPIINNYSWTTHNNPPIDTTNLESLIESLIDIVIYNFSYLFTNLAGLFANLISNIGNFIAYIGQLIEYYGNLIISNIQNAITTFYNNMVSLFDPVLDGISYLIEPLDQEAVYDTFALTSFNTDLIAIQTNFNSFFGQFSDISEPSTYKIPIHFENISMFSGVGVQYLDLGWLDSVKTLLRAFLWCVTTYGLIAGIFDAIPNYINGGGGEDD